MANQTSPGDRPVSPTSTKSFQRIRRKSASASIPDQEAVELRTPRASEQKNQSRQHVSDVTLDGALESTAVNPGPSPLHSGASPRAPAIRQVRQHVHEGDTDGVGTAKVTLHDIKQSRWIEDPNNHASEKVYLTYEDGPLGVMSNIETSFCWVHLERGRDMHFEDFVVSSLSLPSCENSRLLLHSSSTKVCESRSLQRREVSEDSR